MARAKGQGRIIEKRRGVFQIVYDAPRDASGRRRQVYETLKGTTKKEAGKVLQARIQAVSTGAFVAKTDESVAAFLRYWLDTYAATNVTLRTAQGYEANLERYAIPIIGGVKLQELRGHHVDSIFASMKAKGLSSRTQLHCFRVLNQALGHAVRWERLLKNPCGQSTPPRAAREEMAVWDTATIHRFLDAAPNHRYGDIFHLAVLTGLRRSEILGLRWDSVDTMSGKIQIKRTLQRIYGKGLVVGQPKTAKSRRTVPLTPTAVNLVSSVRTKQLERRLAAGPAWNETDYVFTKADGTPVDPDEVSHGFHKLVVQLGLPPLTFHGLRHAFATLLLTSGVHAKVVSEILGHSTIAVTMDTYSHVLPSLAESAVMVLEESLGNAVAR